MGVELQSYEERKDRYLRMVLWRVFNATIFPLLPSCLSNLALRMCGAKIGKSLVYRSVRVYAPWKLEIGDWSCIGPRVELYCKDRITIGDNSVISQDSYLCTASHDVNSCTMALVTKPIVIQDGVWVAAKVIVLPGVEMHSGSVAGAGSVVAKSVGANDVVVGNPARQVSTRKNVEAMGS